MSIKEILSTLALRNIQVNVVDGNLDLIIPKESFLPSDLITAIKKNKFELIAYIESVKHHEEDIPKSAVQVSYPLSSAQERLWVLSQMAEGSIAYNMPVVLAFKGKLDLDKFNQAINLIIERHESLRTTFGIQPDGTARQFIARAKTVNFRLLLSDLSETTDFEAAVWEEIAKEIRTPFDLQYGPLLKGTAYYQSERYHVLCFIMHHIISDAWSIEVFTHELLVYYNALINNKHPEIPLLRIQYKDFSAWQHQQLSGAAYERHKQYWIEQLAGELPVVELPAQKKRPLTKTYHGDTIKHLLRKDTIESINQFSVQRRGTLFIGLLASFYALLYRYTGQEDFIVGSPAAGRKHDDLKDQIGFFVNILALRTKTPKGIDFISLFENTKQTVFGALEHEVYQFDQLLDDLKLVRDKSRSPIFDLLLVLQNVDISSTPDATKEFDGITVEFLPVPETTSKFDMTFNFYPLEEGMALHLEYNTDIYTREFALQMARHFENIVVDATQYPEKALDDLHYMQPDELNFVLDKINSTTVECPLESSIVQVFEETVRQFPNKNAILAKDRVLTYLELDLLSAQLSTYLTEELNVKPNDFIAINLERSEWLIISILAVLKAGAVYVPIDSSYPPERIEYILENSDSKIVINQEVIDSFCRIDSPVVSQAYLGSGSDLAYLMYTSGSSGQPKGVLVEQRSVLRLVKPCTFVDLTSADTLLVTGAPAFDSVTFEYWSMLLNGGALVLRPKNDLLHPSEMKNTIDQEHVNMMWLTSPWFNQIMDEEESTFDSLNTILIGGDKLSPHHVEKLRKRRPDINIINGYGPTENTTFSLCYTVEAVNEMEIPIGKPIGNSTAYILDGGLNPVPFEVKGEIYVGGKGLARGYHRLPELTAEKFIKNPFIYNEKLYKTGDLAKITNDGIFHFLGRNDEQVKVRGYRIEVSEIENILLRYPPIKEAIVLPREVEGGKELLAFYVLNKKVTAKDIKKYLISKIPDYMIPSSFIEMDAFPLTENGKSDKKILLSDYATNAERVDFVAPQEEFHRHIARVWTKILSGVEPGLYDDFFEIGGHSLRAISLLNLYHKEFGVELSIVDFFNKPRLIEQEELIRSADQKQFVAIPVAPQKEFYPLSSAQKRLLFLQEFDPESISYNIPVYTFLGQSVDHGRLEHAINLIVERHDSLRTSFIKIDGETYQQIKPTAEVVIDKFECAESELFELLKRLNNPFDLSRGPLLKTCLIHIENYGYLWAIILHHIISDGTSQEILTEEFIKLYRGEELPPLKLQYKDYSEWQNGLATTGKLDQQKNFWANTLAGDLPLLNLPTDFNRPETFTFEGSTYNFKLDTEITKRLQAFIAARGITLQMALLGVLKTLFYKYTEQEDIIVGISIANRRHPDIQQVVGMFVNSLAIRSSISREKLLPDFLEEIRLLCLNAYENQDVQFEEIVDLLNVRRDPSRNPVFDVALVVQNFERFSDDSEQVLTDLPVELLDKIDLVYQSSKFDMTWFVTMADDSLDISIEYYSRIYAKPTIEKFCTHFNHILNIILEERNIRIGDVTLINDKEECFILEKCVDGPVVEAVSDVSHAFDQMAQVMANKTAILVGDIPYSYSQIQAETNKFGHFLKSTLKHNGQQPKAALLLAKSKDVIVAILSALKSGVVYIPLDPDYPEDRLVYILRDSSADVLIVDAQHAELGNRLLWRANATKHLICIDSDDFYSETAGFSNDLMQEELWDHVGDTASNLIEGGGWVSSYTGEALSAEEMDEYTENVVLKLKEILRPDMRVLEIGCSSGLTMFRIAPFVKEYYGIDLSSSILENTQNEVRKRGLQNISLKCLGAHQINELNAGQFDIIILNSVVHCFSGYNYLRGVLGKALELCRPQGYFFLGDIMDEEKRDGLIADLKRFRDNRENGQHKTKVDWTSEFFVHKNFFRDLIAETPGMKSVNFSDKIYSIENELTKFRYDAIIQIDKAEFLGKDTSLNKFHYDLQTIRRYSEAAWLNEIQGADLAYILYTSGSMGQPKGVMIRRDALANYINWAIQHYSDKNGGEYFMALFTSLSFDLTVTSIFLPLLSGGTLHIFEPELDVAEVLKHYFNPESGLNTIKLTPSHIALLENLGLTETRIFTAIVGGEALRPIHIQTLRNINPSMRIFNEYGPTETTVGCTVWEYTSKTPVLIGRPIANTSLFILDERKALVPVGMIGELCIGGKGLAVGYLNQESLNAEKFVKNPYKKGEKMYHTGDLGRLSTSGDIEFLGRKDEQIKIRGYRIELDEIANVLSRQASVKSVAVVAQKVLTDDLVIVAYCVSDGKWDPNLLRQSIATVLPAYMVPNYYVRLDELPLTINGKLNKIALPKVEPGEMAIETDQVLPATITEEKVAKIWKKVLGLESVSVAADFFVLGGHSLRATKLTSLYEQEFGVKITLKSLFEHTTISKQAALIDKAGISRYETIQPAPFKPYYAPSSAQKRLYFLHEMAPESTSYNMPLVQFLGLEADLERVKTVFQQLLNRHEGLRTSFVKLDGSPFQNVQKKVDASVEYYECTLHEFKALADRFVRPFDLSRAPLVRLALVKVEGAGYALLIDEHHIISDGTSHQILTEEFLRLYAGGNLPGLELQYKDFSEWQNLLLQSGRIDEQKEYWRQRFQDGIPTLKLPLDKPRPEVFTFAGDRTSLTFGKESYQALRALGTKHGATLQMTLLAALNIVFYKKSGQEDIVIGCGIAGRRHANLENVYGMFVNSLAIRNRPDKNLTFSEFFQQVINNCLDAYDNQDVQFEELVDVLQVERDPARNPVFDVLLVVQNFEKSAMMSEGRLFQSEATNELLQHIDYDNKTSKFDMTFFAWEGEDELTLQAEYYTDIYNKSTIDETLAQLLEVIKQVGDDPSLKIDDIDMLSNERRDLILQQFSLGPFQSLPEYWSVPERFAEQVLRSPDAVALVGGDGTLTYAELDRTSNQLAHLLSGQLGVQTEDRIGVLQFRNAGLLQSILGALKAGGAYVSLDPNMPEERLLFIINDSRIEVILAEKSLVGLASKLQWRSKHVKHIVCVDSHNIYQEHGGIHNQLTEKELWDHVGEKAGTDIEAGGWLSSYTGLPISDTEMNEYSDNAYLKLQSHLFTEMKVLEIGCSSGLTMFKVAPHVARYVGTDLSSSILNKTNRKIKHLGLNNIDLYCMPADQINRLEEKGFDLVIINSVIQCFEDYNYLRDVLNKAIDLMSDKGLLFLGDLMDEDRRSGLLDDLRQFKMSNQNKDYRTKLDWSSELFVAKGFLTDFASENQNIATCNFSEKIKTIDNELTKFRYDAILQVDKIARVNIGEKFKYQYDLNNVEDQPTVHLNRKLSKDNLCYVMYTSGSTGLPKGVQIDHKGVLRLVCDPNFIHLSANSILLATGASSFDATTFEYWGMLLNGGKLVLLEKQELLDTDCMKKTIVQQGVNTMWFTAGWLNELVDTDINVFEGLQTVIAGGDKLSVSHISRLKNAYPDLRIINGYGPTENTTFSLTHEIVDLNQPTIPIGKPISNSKAYILNEKNKVVAIDVTGEIVLGGDGLARAYQNETNLTAEKFRESPFFSTEKLYWSGDLGRWKPDGTIEFIGRKDDQVKVRGFRVELGEVESALIGLAEVEGAIVIKHDTQDELVAFITVLAEQPAPEELKAELARKLPEQLLPSQILVVDKFPLTNNGKVDRKALLAKLNHAEALENNEFDTPANEIESQIAAIWSELLGREKIGRNDDFFMIGGHSLKAISLISAYSKHFGIKVSLQDIFSKTTIADQVVLLADSPKLQFNHIPVAPQAPDYPVSHAQRRLWVLSQFEEGSAAYNMPFQVMFDAGFDKANFEKALLAVIRRHDALRTVFLGKPGGEVRQKVLSASELNFQIAHYDLKDSITAYEISQDYIKSDLFHLFDLANGPLLRAMLFALPDNKFLFYLNMHHIISDGWSMEVIKRDLLAYYDAFSAGKEPGLPELRIQYKDYSLWQLGEITQKRFADSKDYWKNKLTGPIGIIDLPATKKRPLVKTYNGRTLYTYIGRGLTSGLKQYTAEREQSLFMGLVSAFKILLHRYTGEKDIVVGTPLAGRIHDDLKDQVGFYINTVVLRDEIDGNYTFEYISSQVKNTVLAAFEHQNYPFDLLVEDLRLTRDTSRGPVFDVMVTLQNVLETENWMAGQGQPDEIIDAGTGKSQFDIGFTFQEFEDGLSLRVDFNTDIYDTANVERLIKHFKNLLEIVVRSPEIKIRNINVLSAEESQEMQIFIWGKRVDLRGHLSLVELFYRQVQLQPKAEALIFGSERYTYQELDELSNQLSAYLIQAGVQRGDLVGIQQERGPWLVISMLAILKSGGAYVPIDPEYPEDRVAYIRADSQCRVVLDAAALSVFESTRATYPALPPGVLVGLDDTAYVIYTSGSTGRPKGCRLLHRGVVNRIDWMWHELGFKAGEKVLQKTTFTFDVSVWEFFLPLCWGNTMVMCSKEDTYSPARLLSLIEEHQVNSLHFVPSMFKAFLSELESNGHAGLIRNLNKVITSGEALSALDVDRWYALTETRLYNLYGPTEASIDVTWYETKHGEKETPIGRPIWNTQMYVLGEKQEVLPAGISGEICIGGIGLSTGYLNLPELTAEKFIDHPFKPGEKLYRTGDKGKWRSDGALMFEGRFDDQVKIRGYRIELGEIEHALLLHPAIEHAAVTVRELPGGDKQLIGYYVSDTTIPAEELKSHLEDTLPPYMLPSFYVHLQVMPQTSSGKVDRKSLPTAEGALLSQRAVYTPPQNDIEAALTTVWKEVLDVEWIGTQDSFFELGGDSIKSILVVNRLRQAGYALKVQDVFNSPVLRDLAKLVFSVTRQIDQSTVIGPVELTPIQRMFLEEFPVGTHQHYNQSVLIRSADRINESVLKQCMIKIVRHHDALRMVYSSNGAVYTQENHGISGELFKYSFYDLIGESEAIEMMGEKGDELQRSFNLSEGPLFAVGHFRLPDGDHVALICHHLVIDGVSWRILLEDLSTLYSQLQSGLPAVLPPKTDSYQRWAGALGDYARRIAGSAIQSYWASVLAQSVPAFPTDKANGSGILDSSFSFKLDTGTTALLQTKSHKAYQTEMNDLLLVSLGLALREVLGVDRSIIQMEGHGREEILENIDIGRTIGWFTSMYPFVLDVSRRSSDLLNLVEVKEDLRRIPNKGIDYGILKYLGEGFPGTPEAGILFNYLGDFGNAVGGQEGSGFEYDSGYIGEQIAPGLRHKEKLDVSGMMVAGELTMVVRFSESWYYPATISRLADTYERILKGLAEELANIPERMLTPSDLTYSGLGIDEVLDLNSDSTLEDIYELSPLQEGIYFNWLANESSETYFEQMSYRLIGKQLDVKKVYLAFSGLVARHSVLRTSFGMSQAGDLLQIVRKGVPVNFRHERVPEGLSAQEKDRYAERAKAEDRNMGFDLSEPSLIRFLVIDFGSGEYEFIWSHHHILMDGWCMSILISEFYQLLNSARDSSKVSLPVPVPYSNYIKWLRGVDKADSLEYWENYLKGYSTICGLPFERNTAGMGYEAGVERLVLTGERYAQLSAMCIDSGITQNTFIQGAWGYLLSSYNNVEDVVFGAVVSGRPDALVGVESMVGLFINTIPVRVSYAAGYTPVEMLKKLQRESVNSLGHHYVSLPEVQSKSELGMDLINHIMVFQNYVIQEIVEGPDTGAGDDLSVLSVDVFERTNYDLNIIISPGRDSLQIDIQYNGSVYDRDSMPAVARHLEGVIGQFIARKDEPIRQIEYLTGAERELLLNRFNDTQVETAQDGTLVDLFCRQVIDQPDAEALIFGAGRYTYKELDDLSNQLSRYLIESGVRRGDLVGIQQERGPWLVISMLAILKSGGAYVPIDPEYPEERIAYIREDSQCRVVLDASTLAVFEMTREAYPTSSPGVSVGMDDTAYVLYTSGSTGRPKGCRLSHRGVVNRIDWQWHALGFQRGEKVLQKTTFTFDVSVWEFFLPLCWGNTMVMCQKEDTYSPARLLSLIEEHQVNSLHFVPSMFKAFLSELESGGDAGSIGSLNKVITSGEALAALDVDRWYALSQTPLYNLYGPTEASIDVTWYETQPGEVDTPIGRPIWNTGMYVLDLNQKLLPVGVPGEICIGGVGLSTGYVNRPELTAEKFIDHPFRPGEKLYRTGDLGQWRSDGVLMYLGRLDDQVKIRGYRIELGEIEQAILSHVAVEHAAVTVRESADGDKELIGYYVSREALPVEELKSHLGATLPPYMVPSFYVHLTAMPQTASGKVDRKALPTIDNMAVSQRAPYLAPTNEIEAALARVWENVLGVEKVGIQDDFFALGGHSLKAVKVLARTNAEFRLDIKLTEVFDRRTIEEMAVLIKHMLWASSRNEFKNVESEDYLI